jgi:cysteine desulfurase / selenocysteine lyase
MDELAAARKQFPFVEQAVYLNTASVGLSWRGLGEACGEFYSAYLRGICGRSDWVPTAARARARLAGVLGVEMDAISFTGNTTEALNLACHGLPLSPGSRIAVAADEFPSLRQAAISLRKARIETTAVAISRESERTEALIAAAADSQAVLVSHVHYRSGARVDLQRLAAACSKSGAWLVVDGMQAVGAVPVQAALADAYCGSSFKWLLGGFGLGFMTFSDRLAREWTPPFRGYENEWPARGPQYGHLNYPGIFALGASLGFLESVGWPAIFQRVSLLATRLHTGLVAQGFRLLTPPDAAAGIVSVYHPDATEVVRQLASESIFVEDRNPIVRVSPHFYNTEAEIDRFVAAFTEHSRRSGKG